MEFNVISYLKQLTKPFSVDPRFLRTAHGDRIRHLLHHPGLSTGFSYAINLVTGRVIYQHNIQPYLGYTEEEVDLPQILGFYHPEDRSEVIRLAKRALMFATEHHLEPHRYAIRLWHRMISKSGRVLQVQRLSSILEYSNLNEPLIQYSICNDISELSPSPMEVRYCLEFPRESVPFKQDYIDRYFGRPQTHSGQKVRFTARELQVLRGTAHGKLPSEIAKELQISEETVKDYHKRMRKKLSVRKTIQVVVYALRCGLL